MLTGILPTAAIMIQAKARAYVPMVVPQRGNKLIHAGLHKNRPGKFKYDVKHPMPVPSYATLGGRFQVHKPTKFDLNLLATHKDHSTKVDIAKYSLTTATAEEGRPEQNLEIAGRQVLNRSDKYLDSLVGDSLGDMGIAEGAGLCAAGLRRELAKRKIAKRKPKVKEASAYDKLKI